MATNYVFTVSGGAQLLAGLRRVACPSCAGWTDLKATATDGIDLVSMECGCGHVWIDGGLDPRKIRQAVLAGDQ